MGSELVNNDFNIDISTIYLQGCSTSVIVSELFAIEIGKRVFGQSFKFQVNWFAMKIVIWEKTVFEWNELNYIEIYSCRSSFLKIESLMFFNEQKLNWIYLSWFCCYVSPGDSVLLSELDGNNAIWNLILGFSSFYWKKNADTHIIFVCAIGFQKFQKIIRERSSLQAGYTSVSILGGKIQLVFAVLAPRATQSFVLIWFIWSHWRFWSIKLYFIDWKFNTPCEFNLRCVQIEKNEIHEI